MHKWRDVHDWQIYEQPGLSREKQFAKYSFKKILFVLIGEKQRQKRIDQSQELSDRDLGEIMQSAV